MAIHAGQYASFDTISFILRSLNGENGALFLPKAECAFLIVTALQRFHLPVPQESKIIPTQM